MCARLRACVRRDRDRGWEGGEEVRDRICMSRQIYMGKYNYVYKKKKHIPVIVNMCNTSFSKMVTTLLGLVAFVS